MKVRIRNKISKRFELYDHMLVMCFTNGRQRYWSLIKNLRSEIQHMKRRWPSIYRSTFGIPDDIGHHMAGRRD